MRAKRRLFPILVFCFLGIIGCGEEILHDLDELQANRVRVALAKVGIEAWKEQRGTAWVVGVSSGEVAAALSLLDSKRVVRKANNSHASSASLIQSKEERRHFVERSLSRGLEQTLERVPGVLEARVHIKMLHGNRSSTSQRPVGGSASVLLVQAKSVEIAPNAIKELVAGASGISREGIAVVSVIESEKEEVIVDENATDKDSIAAFRSEPFKNLAISPMRFILFLGISAIGLLGLMLYVRSRRLNSRLRTSSSVEPNV